MALVNEHFLKLPGSYLFSDIAKKVNTLVASPVISTCLVAMSHRMLSEPPSMMMMDSLPARPVRKAATAVAQAPVPQA